MSIIYKRLRSDVVIADVDLFICNTLKQLLHYNKFTTLVSNAY